MTPDFEDKERGVQLYCADCMTVLPHLSGIDAVVTDPPYGVGFSGKRTKHTCATHEELDGYNLGDSDIGPKGVRLAMAIAKRGVVFPGNRLMFDYDKPYEIGSVYCPSGSGLGRWGFTTSHPILFYGMGLPHTRQGPAGFESFDTQEPNGHPCPKPLRWMIWSVNKCTLEGHTVLDPFMGSGTTGIACLRTGRKFIGIEIDPHYFAVAKERIQRELAQGVLL